MSDNHPAARLKQLIERKNASDPVAFQYAVAHGVLLQYLANDVWLADIDPSLVLLYQRSSWDFEMRCIVDSYVTLASEALDSKFFQNYYASQQPPNAKQYGIKQQLLTVRSQYKVVQPLHKIKVTSVAASFVCLGFGIVGGLRGRLPTAALMAIASPDLLRISYNCCDQRYGELYLKSLAGNVNRTCDTVYLSIKSLLGLIPLEAHPIIRLHREVNLDLLLHDTITRRIWRQVRSVVRELR